MRSSSPNRGEAPDSLGPQLPLGMNASFADISAQHSAATAIFNNSMQVAERALPSKREAIEFALRQTKKLTGVDWSEDLRCSSTQESQVVRNQVHEFIDIWRSGELALPWAPVLCTDIYSAFQGWQSRQKGVSSVSMRQFVTAARKEGSLTSCRKRWRNDDGVQGPAAFLIPVDARKNSAAAWGDWLGESVDAFRKAAKRTRSRR